MSDSLPDPLSLWLRTSGAPAEAVDVDSLAASFQALWRNQKELVKALGATFGQESLAELAIELTLNPMIRQAQLLALAPIPNPKQAVVLSAALNSWLASQLTLVQAAATDIQSPDSARSNASILEAWLVAFSRRQSAYLQDEQGRQLFAQLSRAWAGLDIEASDNRERQAEGGLNWQAIAPEEGAEKPSLGIIAPVLCPLASFDRESCGLLRGLSQSFDLQVLDWGALDQVQSLDELRSSVAQVLSSNTAGARLKVLDLSGVALLPQSALHDLYRITLPEGDRLLSLMAQQSTSDLGLSREYIPGELLSVLCDAIYPDWAVDAWLESERGGSALSLRRAWLPALPAMSGALLQDLLKAQSKDSSGVEVLAAREQSLLQLLNNENVGALSQELLTDC